MSQWGQQCTCLQALSWPSGMEKGVQVNAACCQHMYMCVCIYIYTYMHARMPAYFYMHVYIHIYICTTIDVCWHAGSLRLPTPLGSGSTYFARHPFFG